ncbi:MAG: hypothetical protein JO117_00400 [Verrucomicrobia bacterium]|nr:hypothetical protein [Verrucomicrobiota bacterium]MBV9659141.1 hypothetical protein [Verrucomicrobiota bacterium]
MIIRSTIDAWVASSLVAGLLVFAGVDAYTHLVQSHRQAARGGDAPALSLIAPLSGQELAGAEIFEGADSLVEVENLGPLEFDGDNYFRHALGPTSVFLIRSERRHARLRLRFYNLIVGQHCQIAWNDTPLASLTDLPLGMLQHHCTLDLRPGEQNRLVITYALYNHTGVELSPAEARPLAGTFFDLGFDFFD